MKELHIFTPQGGVNSDDSNETIDSVDYRDANDLEIGFDGNKDVGAARRTRGLRRALPFLGTGYEELYALENTRTNTMVVLVWAANGNHQVREVYKDGTQDIMIESPSLGFSSELITTGNIIDDLLTFTQPGQPPKAFLMSKARKFYESGGTDPDGYTEFTPDMVLAGALPPRFSPKCKYEVGFQGVFIEESWKPSFINDDSFQFAYYYIYDDKTHSTPSPISKLAFPYKNISMYGVSRYRYENKQIRVSFNTGISTVEKVVVMSRRGNVGAWEEVHVVDKKNEGYGDNETRDVLFTATESGALYSRNFANYHYLPITAKYQSFLFSNNIVYANYETGYDKILPDVSLELKGRMFDNPHEADVRFATRIMNGETDPGGTPRFIGAGTVVGIKIPLPYQPGVRITFDLIWMPRLLSIGTTTPIAYSEDSPGVWHSPGWTNNRYRRFRFDYITPDDVPSVEVARWLIEDELISQWRTWTGNAGKHVYLDISQEEQAVTPGDPKVWTPSLTPGIDNSMDDYQARVYFPDMVIPMNEAYMVNADGSAPPDPDGLHITSQRYFIQDLPTRALSKINKSYKRGSKLRFGINYYDKFNRDNSVVIDEQDMVIDVPINVVSSSPIPGLEDLQEQERFALFVEAKVNHVPPKFATHFQWVVSENPTMSSYGYFFITAINVPESYVELALPSEVDGGEGKNFGHYPTEGDFVMVMTYLSSTIANPNHTRVVSFDGVRLYVENVDLFSSSRSLIQIYTPKKDANENTTYFEFGEEYEVIDPHTEDRRHSGGIQDQTESDPAVFELNSESNYVRDRLFSWKDNPDDVDFNYRTRWVEDRRFSDWEIIPAGDKGRVSVYDPNSERKRYDNVYHGGKYFRNTPINDLWVMSSGNEEVMNPSKGEITGLAHVGYTLKVFQQRGVSSIYIGRTIATNADGTENVIGLSNQVFGTVNPSSSPFGCQNPESISTTKRYVYFFDKEMKAWCRDAANGIIAISDYKAKGLWADIVDQSLPGDRFYSAFNEEDNILAVTYPDHSSGVNYTWAFSETRNRWMGRFRFDVEKIYPFGPGVIGFRRNADACELWKGDMGDFAPAITFVVNPKYAVEKILHHLSLQSNVAWTVTQILIPAEISGTGREMVTNIWPERFERYESKFHAYVGGDANTPGMTPAMGVVDGDDMRGQAFIVTMQARGNPRLTHVIASYTDSMNTP